MTTRTVRVRTEIEHPDFPAGDVIIVQPDEDLVGEDHNEVEFSPGEHLRVLIKAIDDTEWSSSGTVVKIDSDEEPLLLGVRVDWSDATLNIDD